MYPKLKSNIINNGLFKSIAFIILFTLLLMACGILSNFSPQSYRPLAYGVLGTIGALLLATAFLRLEGISRTSIGLDWKKNTPQQFLGGCVIGILIFALIFLPLILFSSIQVSFNKAEIHSEAMWILVAILPLALMEEIGFRSYAQFTLNRSYGIWISQIVIALFFGMYHVLNGWGILLAFAGPFVWAFVFGLSAISSKGIALPTGIHFALNLMQNLCGLKNKGYSLLKLELPKDMHGAVVSPNSLGTLLQVGILLLAIAATAYYRKKSKLEPLRTANS